jgi:hypothetical protein
MTIVDSTAEETGWPTKVTRPRYYILDYDGFEARLEFLNRDEVLVDGRASGTHDVRLRDLDFVTSVGLPPLAGATAAKGRF